MATQKRLSTDAIVGLGARPGQVTTFVICAVFSLSFQAVVLLTKTAINHRVFFNLV